MKVITARNVNSAFVEGLWHLHLSGADTDSRNGPVRVSPTPVTTVYTNPTERVIFYPQRDANPFFHLFEALWMLAGRDDVGFPAYYSPNIKNFSDDGTTLNGAYGYRWRRYFNYDQLNEAARQLKADRKSRRVVVSMWSADDLTKSSRDLPCNLMVHFDATFDALNMTVFNRSNDAVWGAYGANAVHFSVLQEYMAARVGIPVGTYYQVSDNFHMYGPGLYGEKLYGRIMPNGTPFTTEPYDPYEDCELMVQPMFQETPYTPVFDAELHQFTINMRSGGKLESKNEFLMETVAPMVRAHSLYKDEKLDEALEECEFILSGDWSKACFEWIQRRIEARKDA